MSDKDIFSSSADQQTPPNQTPDVKTTPQGDDTSSPVAILVGEGRKYKTLEDLAKAYLHVDEFAEKLKAENSTLRSELAKAKTLDEVLERLKAPASPTAPDQGKEAGTKGAGLSAADVAKIVHEQITGLETQRSRQANLAKADAEMKKLFGEKAKDVFDKTANTPQLRETLVALAGVSPEKFVQLFTPAQGASGGQVDGNTSVNTSALSEVNASGRAVDVGCKEFYDQLRRKEPTKYYSHAIQLQMTKAAEANPGKFFGRK